MTEHESKMIRIMEHCVLNAEFCDTCENRNNDYAGCRKTHEQFIDMVKNAIAKRDALLADLNLVCGGKFVDVCCICGHYTPENPNDKCELKGLDCRWTWRGVQKGGTDNVCTGKE